MNQSLNEKIRRVEAYLQKLKNMRETQKTYYEHEKAKAKQEHERHRP